MREAGHHEVKQGAPSGDREVVLARCLNFAFRLSVSLIRLEISFEVILHFLRVSTISSSSNTLPKNEQNTNLNENLLK